MSKQRKKSIAFILALIMVFSLVIPIGAIAAGDEYGVSDSVEGNYDAVIGPDWNEIAENIDSEFFDEIEDWDFIAEQIEDIIDEVEEAWTPIIENIENIVNNEESTIVTRNVSDWTQLRAAISDATVSHITFTNPITRTGAAANHLPSINRSLVIDGNGHTLNFGGNTVRAFTLARQSTETLLTIENLSFANMRMDYLILHNNSAAAATNVGNFTENWVVHLHNVSHVENQTPAALIKAQNSELVLTGNISWNTTNTRNSTALASTSGMIVVRGVTITNGAVVDLRARHTVINVNPSARTWDTYVVISSGANVNLYSRERQTIWMNRDRPNNNPVFFLVTGSGTVLNARGDGNGTGQANGVISVAGGHPGRAELSAIVINDGAQVTVESLRAVGAGNRSMPAFVSQITQGTFTVRGAGTRVELTSTGGDNLHGATLLFRRLGQQNLNVVDNGELVVNRLRGASSAAAVRFQGRGNTFNAYNGGQVTINNAGSGLASNTANSAIDFTFGGAIHVFRGASVNLNASFGPAIVNREVLHDNLAIGVRDLAYFVAVGRTSTAAGGAINSGRPAIVMFDHARNYDIANRRPGGGPTFTVHRSSTMVVINSELNLWRAGTDIGGGPTNSWERMDFTLSDVNFSTVAQTSLPGEFTQAALGAAGLRAFSRIQGGMTGYAVPHDRLIEQLERAPSLAQVEDFTASSWNHMIQVRLIAELLRLDSEATRSAVNEATDALRDAIDNLVNIRGLRIEVGISESIRADGQPGNISHSDWNQFLLLLSRAQTVLTNPEATRPEVDAATLALNNVRYELGLTTPDVNVDLSGLRNEIGASTELFLAGRHPDVSMELWNDFSYTLLQAQITYYNSASTQEDVDDATEVLASIRRQVEDATGEREDVDARELEREIELSEIVYRAGRPSNVSVLIWNGFALDLRLARATIDNPAATQAQVDIMAVALAASRIRVVGQDAVIEEEPNEDEEQDENDVNTDYIEGDYEAIIGPDWDELTIQLEYDPFGEIEDWDFIANQIDNIIMGAEGAWASTIDNAESVARSDTSNVATQTVSTWDELRAAMSNPAIGHITLSNSITRTGAAANHLPSINRSLVIDGNGHTLDFGGNNVRAFVLSRQSAETTLTIENLRFSNMRMDYLIIHTDTTAAATQVGRFTENWIVHLHNVSHVESQTPAALIKAQNSELVLTGNISWNTTNTRNSTALASTSGMIVVRGVTITDGAVVDLSARHTVININPDNRVRDTYVVIRDGANVNLYSRERQAIWMNRDRPNNNPVLFFVTGAGTVLNARSDGTGTGQANGVISVAGGHPNSPDSSAIIIDNGARVNVESLRAVGSGNRAMPAFISQISQGTFNIRGANTRVELTSIGGDSVNGATLLFRRLGQQNLNVFDGAELVVNRLRGVSSAAAVRFQGRGNTLNVYRDASVRINNAGSGVASNTANAAIYFTAGGRLHAFSGGSVELNASFGPAIRSAGGVLRPLIVGVRDLATFVASGRTGTALGGVINSNTTILLFDHAQRYDIVNTRPGGGQAFNVGTYSLIAAVNSELDLWRSGTNTSGDPSRSWARMEFLLTGNDFRNFRRTSLPEEFSQAALGNTGLRAYSRVQGGMLREDAPNYILIEQIERAPSVVRMYEFTRYSWERMMQARVVAELVRRTPNVPRVLINEATVELRDSIDELVYIRELKIELSISEVILAEGQPQNISHLDWNQFVLEITRAQTVLYNTSTSQAHVDAALASLRGIRNRLGLEAEVGAVLSALRGEIEVSNEIFTAGRHQNVPLQLWGSFSAALLEAQLVYSDLMPTQAEVDNATESLANLRIQVEEEMARPIEVDFSELRAEIEISNPILLAGRPASIPLQLWVSFVSAHNNAQAVSLNSSSTQEQVDNATTHLANARAQVTVQVSEVPPEVEHEEEQDAEENVYGENEEEQGVEEQDVEENSPIKDEEELDIEKYLPQMDDGDSDDSEMGVAEDGESSGDIIE